MRIEKLHTTTSDGSQWLAELYQRFTPVRQEAIDREYTEQEINDTIDEALKEVRRQRS